jgi:hypothetical protein
MFHCFIFLTHCFLCLVSLRLFEQVCSCCEWRFLQLVQRMAHAARRALLRGSACLQRLNMVGKSLRSARICHEQQLRLVRRQFSVFALRLGRYRQCCERPGGDCPQRQRSALLLYPAPSHPVNPYTALHISNHQLIRQRSSNCTGPRRERPHNHSASRR